ncbi:MULTISPECIES: MFS transporter [unclassified Oceanispirochaeta]|uniref:MFS transporter n=1 Tax=unclassified Oceanispirochaeta TaxID=2635722 RepID=UPI000E09B851|nr:MULTISPECIES: MFS transporter [unclassified Oceanispirochaeta]MBF9015797.1 MFS transporter [Oceanispirochaeta sp. M2]NPD72260.1 MFS transporter [Oceanispirochaeta sp. M1]RDG32356.1 MFS transporter [Oceanispirochaeta sp. M1]
MITKDQKSSYFGFLWHGIFLALTVTFTEVNSVLPALVLQVGGSELHIGFITAIMVGFPLVSQLLFAPFIQSRKRKKPYLIAGLYARMMALFGIGLLLNNAGRFSPSSVLIFIYCGLTVFTLSGAFAGISYVSLIGTSIPRELRHKFFLRKQVFWSAGVLVSGVLTRFVLTGFAGTQRYTFLFVLASLMLALGSIGFWMIKEPESESVSTGAPGLKGITASIREILSEDISFRYYCIVANLLTVSIVLIPFYLPSLLRTFNLPSSYVGTIVLLQMGGMLLSNFLWPKIIGPLGFKGLLKIQSIASLLIPLTLSILLFSGQGLWVLYLIFPMLGALSGAHKMSGEAVLVQISREDKRALYSGIYGALNLSSALAPLLFGLLLRSVDFRLFFPVIGILSLSALFVINKMICPVDVKKAKDDMIGAR